MVAKFIKESVRMSGNKKKNIFIRKFFVAKKSEKENSWPVQINLSLQST